MPPSFLLAPPWFLVDVKELGSRGLMLPGTHPHSAGKGISRQVWLSGCKHMQGSHCDPDLSGSASLMLRCPWHPLPLSTAHRHPCLQGCSEINSQLQKELFNTFEYFSTMCFSPRLRSSLMGPPCRCGQTQAQVPPSASRCVTPSG